MARTRRTWIILGIFLSGAAATGVIVREAVLWNQPPTFTCSTPDSKACADTERSIIGDRQLVFSSPLPARLVAVDIRPVPSGTRHERDWAVLLTLEGRQPLSQFCYYSSDDMVACGS